MALTATASSMGPTKETRGKYLAQVDGKPTYIRVVIKNKKL